MALGICDTCGNEADLNEDQNCPECAGDGMSDKEDLDGFTTGEEVDE